MSVEALAYVKMLDLGDCENAVARLVLYVIGENTFNDSARCKLTQKQIAFEAGRISDRTLRRHLDALAGVAMDENGKAIRDDQDRKTYVEPIFIRQHPQKDDDTGARVEDWIEIVGFEDWYREQSRSKKRPSPPVKMSGAPTGQNVQGDRTGSPEPLDTAASGTPGQQESGHKGIRTSNRTSEVARSSAQEDSLFDFQVKALRDALDRELGRNVFEAWFASVAFDCAGSKLVASTALKPVRNWIRDHYEALILRLAKSIWPEVAHVDFILTTGVRAQ